MEPLHVVDGRCAGCARLVEEVVRLRAASDKRARGDHDRCVALFAQMERLARINQSVLHDGSTGGNGGDDECESRRAGDGRSSVESLDERVERLQAIVMEQAKELESLRRRRPSFERFNHLSKHDMDNWTTGECRMGNQQDKEEGEMKEARGPRGYAVPNRSPVSLLAQLDAKDRRIRALEVCVSKMEAQLQQARAKKLSAARESQQQLTRLQQHSRKYEAYTRKQQHEIHTLEKKLKEMREYVSVLEQKLVASSGKRDLRGFRS